MIETDQHYTSDDEMVEIRVVHDDKPDSLTYIQVHKSSPAESLEFTVDPKTRAALVEMLTTAASTNTLSIRL
ncbi:hypothetical protein [Streptomyces sp. CBMA123]|uniref:hypothetical protein n=1 Tax=Streptomyces sp. CBMA123 TaxID=1896313 RepID=UPI001661B459|nr:hypothetical protein [Streptomyces sp. CBMA123]MBD0689676.1 hypothetical protein [Streptomyces sp. CBMA123]